MSILLISCHTWAGPHNSEELVLEQVRAPLRFRPFKVVLAGEGLSMVGDGAFGVALAWLALQKRVRWVRWRPSCWRKRFHAAF